MENTNAQDSGRKTCSLCRLTFHPKILKLHVEAVHPSKTKKSHKAAPLTSSNQTDNSKNCEYCSRRIPPTRFSAHQKSCKSVFVEKYSNNKFQCKGCKRSYNSGFSLQRHWQSIHQKIKDFACKKCSETFNNSRSLEEHTFSKHLGINVACNFCSKEYVTKQTLLRHIKNVHNEVKLDCDQCDKKFTRLEYLKRHKISCHSGTRYFCDICGQWMKTSRLYKHQCKQEYVNRPIPKLILKELKLSTKSKSKILEFNHHCQECPKEFYSQISLRMHIKAIHEKK